MDQDATWYGGRPQPWQHCVRWEPSSAAKGHSPPIPQFSAHVCCGQMVGWIKMPHGTEIDLGPSHIVLDGDPGPPERGTAAPLFSTHVYCGKRSLISATAERLL